MYGCLYLNTVLYSFCINSYPPRPNKNHPVFILGVKELFPCAIRFDTGLKPMTSVVGGRLLEDCQPLKAPIQMKL